MCSICGGDAFEAGPGGRMSLQGVMPQCRGCGSLERHRIIRAMYSALMPETKKLEALQFAPDQTVDPANFKSYQGSTYGGEFSLDMMNTALPDGSFDMIISNHVLEHVRDDSLALAECLRVVGNGVIHINAPLTNWLAETDDWGYADSSRTFHYRHYGADLGLRLTSAVDGVFCFAATGMDPVTQVMDQVYFFSKSGIRLKRFMTLLQSSSISCVKVK